MLRAALGSPKHNIAARKRTASSWLQSWFQGHVTPLIQLLSRRACTHPIHTLVFIAFIASAGYVGLLEGELFAPPPTTDASVGHADLATLLAGSKTLYTSVDTAWKWQNGDQDVGAMKDFKVEQNLTLFTLVFPDSITHGPSSPLPNHHYISMLGTTLVEVLPSSKNLLSAISHESTLAFSVPHDQASDFVSSVQELVANGDSADDLTNDTDDSGSHEQKRWIMGLVRGDISSGHHGFRKRTQAAWTAFVDLLKNAEELDIIIMFLGYLSMHLTFVSLFMSLRRLGSNFWLGTTVLFSSSFALLFALVVTTKFGVSLNMVLLSEGLPFLVVTIGFEKPIILTKAVLAASLELKKTAVISGASMNREASPSRPALPDIQTAIQVAVKEQGYEIVRDYAAEIAILVIGAASGVQERLSQFCFLAAWILFFDCVLLFTFYTSILTIKLEINRIKRHVALRRALEEDGVSRKVAEEVASSDEWPTRSIVSGTFRQSRPDRGSSIFSFKSEDMSISRFKVLMVTGFIAINVLNLCTIPFRSGTRSTGSALSSVVTQPPMDPFKVAGNGLDTVLASAKERGLSTSITVLAPIKYELAFPSDHYALPTDTTTSIFELDFADQLLSGAGSRVVEGILRSFEDPILGKWIIVILVLSLVLNGYLFNAARWSIKEPGTLMLETESEFDGKALKTNDVFASETDQSHELTPKRATPRKPQPDHDQDEEDGLILRSPRRSIAKRSPEDCESMLREKKAPMLNDEELIDLAIRGKIPGHALEKVIEDKTRAVKVRRAVVSRTPITREFTALLEKSQLPYERYDYDRVHGACCENVIGYLPLPLGVAGPLVIDGQSYFLPMATTEGVLVASTSRGCKAINAGGGAVTVLTGDGMTRGPCVGFSNLTRAGAAKLWLDSEDGQRTMKVAFNSTSRFARLQSLKTALAGTYLYIRFKTTTGDAMGMNMISKGVENALHVMANESGFDDMAIISVSGNFCTDKKPAAINWIDGRGKSVVAEAIIPDEVVRSVLKSNVDALVELNISKNLIGSAMAGSIGGFNAHAANIVTAIFLATGQDPAQNVESSNCITVMKKTPEGSLQISVSMPCIEVGTIGGGTFLGPQAAMLDLLGVRGAHPTSPGANARQLARIIGAAVLAGELSLCSALAAGHLVAAHMQHNRSQAPTRTTTPAPPTQPTTAQVAQHAQVASQLQRATGMIMTPADGARLLSR